MLKKLMVTYPKQWLIGTFFIAVIAAALFRADNSLAHLSQLARPALQSNAAIFSHEANFDATYFAENGQLDRLEVTPAGLALMAGYAEGSFTSDVINSPLGFTTDIVPLWQTELPQGTEIRLETRLYDKNGWSGWLENPAAFYPARGNMHSGNLIWAGSNRVALQFRVTLLGGNTSPKFSALTLVFNDTSQGPSDAEIAGQMARVSSADNVCPVERPTVVSRTDWGNPEGQDSPRFSPSYADVTHVIIHQTETPNNTAPYQDYAGWVRSVWNFHANVLGWGDVGYNYLIDPNGVIYEGRAGGENVIGVHDTHNTGSMGIGYIGCYGNCDDPRLSVAEPSAEMMDSAAHLVAWKLGEQGIDPLSSADYNSLSDIPVIAGGRDVIATSAPGDNVYNKLQELRQAVVKKNLCLQPCQITGVIFDQESYSTGDTINVTVRLADSDGVPLPGANVVADVTHQPVASQSATGFGLVDRAGEYDGVYSDTGLPGTYNFAFTASDPAGEQFQSCSANSSVLVEGDSLITPTAIPTEITDTPNTPTPTVPVETPTPTPTTPVDTPTPTPSPTNTPAPTDTPTPTPSPTTEPTGPVVKVEPGNLVLPICDLQGTVAINVENVANMAAVQFEVTYDPSVIQVIDADAGRDGVQVRVDGAFSTGFIAQNEVDTANGRVMFAATLLGSGENINGNSGLIAIDWQPQGAGISAVLLENVILASNSAEAIAHTLQDGIIEVTSNCGSSASGTLQLQGRNNHTGITVTNADGQQTQTLPDGSFSISGSGPLNFNFPGYLSAEAGIPVSIESEPHSTSLGTLTLLAGDTNNDGNINILDLAYIAQNYGLTDTLADLNADGTVDILDLVLAAGNYGQQGPLTAWK